MGFRDSILAGITLIRSAIQSEGFLTGSTGWKIERDGDAEFNDVTMRGELQVGSDPTVIFGERHTGWFGGIAPGIFFDDPDGIDEGFIIQSQSGANGAGFLWLAAPKGNGGATLDNQWGIIIHNEEDGGGISFTSRSGDPTVDATFDHMHVVATGVETYMKCLNGKYVIARVATVKETTNSGNITTTETIVLTSTQRVESGYRYRISARLHIDTSVNGDDVNVRIREDNAAGTVLNIAPNIDIPSNANPVLVTLEGDYVAPSDNAAKTFVCTLVRSAGTGNIIRQSSATQPAFFYIDFVGGP